MLAATGIVLGAAYMLWLYQRVFFGELTNPANEKLKDLNLREQLTLVPLVVLCFWIGLYPKPIFRILEPSSSRSCRRWTPTCRSVPVGAAAPRRAPHAQER